ncbi:MAG: hypothetical protein ABIQ10_09930 [Gemmatimonadaceae bacterium]
MRSAAVLLLVSACASSPQVTPATEVQYTRPLITDQYPFLLERANARVALSRTGWCQQREWPHTDEVSRCDPRPYLNQSTPSIRIFIEYDDEDRAIAYAVFTPVPCRMYGRCDYTLGRTAATRDFLDVDTGLRRHLVDIGRGVSPHEEPMAGMQQRMIDALGVELRHRFGAPVWKEPRDYGWVWTTTTSQIGMFVVDGGNWVIETHELAQQGPPGLAANP